MSTDSVFKVESPWHPSHKLMSGRSVRFHRLGPSGEEQCENCRARRWVNGIFTDKCGGSIDHDTRAERQCIPRAKSALVPPDMSRSGELDEKYRWAPP